MLFITGSHKYTDFANVKEKLDLFLLFNDITEVITSDSIGTDRSVISWCAMNSIKYTTYKPDHIKWANRGYHKNIKRMILKSDCVVILWDGVDTSVHFTINLCKALKKEHVILKVTQECRIKFTGEPRLIAPIAKEQRKVSYRQI